MAAGISNTNIRDQFATALSERDMGRASNAVTDAQEAVSDSNARTSRALSALNSTGGKRTVGGGRFGSFTGNRQGVRLGQITSGGGLSGANRAALKKARDAQVDATYAAKRRAAAMANYGLTSKQADDQLSPRGSVETQTWNGRTTNRRTRIDDLGRQQTDYI